MKNCLYLNVEVVEVGQLFTGLAETVAGIVFWCGRRFFFGSYWFGFSLRLFSSRRLWWRCGVV
jgi:hypothetical protein